MDFFSFSIHWFQSAQEVTLLDYHYTFWEEPQMSGRKLRKDGHLSVMLVESPTAMRRLSTTALKTHRHGFESYRNAYVTLRFDFNSIACIDHLFLCRVDRLEIFLHKSDLNPALSYTLV